MGSLERGSSSDASRTLISIGAHLNVLGIDNLLLNITETNRIG